jgi:hypothetical protein
MAQAHAAQKGAIGLDISDDKGGKEMIDAPMLKQVRDRHIHQFIYLLNSRGVGGEDDSYGTSCRPSNTAALNPAGLCIHADTC